MKISVVTPTFKAAKTLASCCESVVQQRRTTVSGRQFEVEQIVVDAKSEDGTVEVARRFRAVSRIVSESDNGIYDGMNKGIRLAEGDVIGILNADDFYMTNDVLLKAVEALESSGADTCYGNVVYVDPDRPTQSKRVWRGGSFRRTRFRHGWMPPHPAFLVRRSCYERYGLFRIDMGTAADYELMLRLLMREKVSSVWVPNLWVAMRAGGASNASPLARLRANRMDRAAWRVNGLRPPPWMRVMKPLRKLPQYAWPRDSEVEGALVRCWRSLTMGCE